MPYRALLVDDERLARKQLRALLRSFPEIEIVAEAANVTEALAATETYHPEVVFLDIQMPGASGFDFLESAEGPFATIFVTAYDCFALRAFEVNGLDYLLKPVDSERLAAAIRRLPRRSPPSAPSVRSLESSDYLFVTSGSAARFIQVKRIQYIQAAGPYSEIFIEDGSKWMMLRSMKEWQLSLPHTQFARIHRSSIVNLDFVDRIEQLPSYGYRLSLGNGKTQLLISRRRALRLKEHFQ